MGTLALVNRLEVTPHGELYATYRKLCGLFLGGIYYPSWTHTFPTRILRRSKNAEGLTPDEEIMHQLNSEPALSRCGVSGVDKHWHIMQVTCPPSVKDALPKIFIRGNYGKQARWKLAAPSHVVTLDDSVMYALQQADRATKALGVLRNNVYDRMSESKGEGTKVLNRLEAIFGKYDGSNYDAVIESSSKESGLSSLDREILDKRKELSDIISEANAQLNQQRRGISLSYVHAKSSQSNAYVRIEDQTFDYLDKTRARMLSADEILSMKWVMLDIEVPHFMRDIPRISWIGLAYVNGADIRREIHTLYDAGESDVKGYHITQHATENELVDYVAKSIIAFDPAIVSAYNAKFDLIELRGAETGFGIGEGTSNPFFRVTTPFAERIGIRSSFVYDPMMLHRLSNRFDPNHKLEMAAGFEKDITYRDMAELEDQCINGGPVGEASAARIASYLASDVERTMQLVFNGENKRMFECICGLCGLFNLSFESLASSAGHINEAQEHEFFSELGIYRENVPPYIKNKTRKSAERIARHTFFSTAVHGELGEGFEKGLIKDVYKAAIPIGSMLRSAVNRRFSGAEGFYRFMDDNNDSICRFVMEQYAEALSSWIINDYGIFLDNATTLEKAISRTGSTKPEFEQAFRSFRSEIIRTYQEDRGNLHKRIDAMKLRNYKIDNKMVEAHLGKEAADFMQRTGVSSGEFAEMLNQRSRAFDQGQHFLGNYRLYASTRFAGTGWQNKDCIPVLEEILKGKFQDIRNFLTEHGLKVVDRERNYLYITGDGAALGSPASPLILVDHIPLLYKADKPYYVKCGFVHGLKVEEAPDYHRCLFEMKTYGEMLKALMRDDSAAAIGLYENALRLLRGQRVCNSDLVFLNKGNCAYFAYTAIPNEKVTYFITDARFAPRKLCRSSEGTLFYEEGEGEAAIKVYLLDMDRIAPDYEKYASRMESRGRAILAPVKVAGGRHRKNVAADRNLVLAL